MKLNVGGTSPPSFSTKSSPKNYIERVTIGFHGFCEIKHFLALVFYTDITTLLCVWACTVLRGLFPRGHSMLLVLVCVHQYPVSCRGSHESLGLSSLNPRLTLSGNAIPYKIGTHDPAQISYRNLPAGKCTLAELKWACETLLEAKSVHSTHAGEQLRLSSFDNTPVLVSALETDQNISMTS